MSKSVYFGIGDEILSEFLENFFKANTENVEEFNIAFDTDMISLIVKGSYMAFKGTAEYDLILKDYTGRLDSDEHIEFQLIPKNTLSKMMKGAFGMFRGKLEPAVILEKDILKLSVREMVRKWKPEVYHSLDKFKLNQFKISPGNVLISLERL